MTLGIAIRVLRPGDHPDVISLLDACGLHPRVRGRDSRAAFARQLRANRTLYLGAFDGPRLVGMVLGTHDTRKGWINRLAVHPDYRRRGIGRRLVRRCERGLRGMGIEMFAALINGDNEVSKDLFAALGYTTSDILYYRRKVRQEI